MKRAIPSLLALTLLPHAAFAATTVEGTFERFAHGTLEVRSIKDCKFYGFGLPPNPSKALMGEISFAYKATSDPRSAFHKRFIDVIVSANGNGIVDMEPSNSTIDADKTCITDLGTQHLDGTVEGLGYGNNGAGFTLRLSNGHRVEFGWVYDYGVPALAPRLCSHPNEVPCMYNGRRVRVTYKTQSTGDGIELVPTAIDPI
jgi:hypothetical protein